MTGVSEPTVEAALREAQRIIEQADESGELWEALPGINEAIASALAALRSRGSSDTRLTDALRACVEAAWNHDGDLPDAIEAAAANGMTVLGDTISLAAARADAEQEQA